jgi:hypothetical protein
VLQRVGLVAYKLKLSESSQIHLVFHVSQLKKAMGGKYSVTPYLQSELSVFQVLEQIL